MSRVGLEPTTYGLKEQGGTLGGDSPTSRTFHGDLMGGAWRVRIITPPFPGRVR